MSVRVNEVLTAPDRSLLASPEGEILITGSNAVVTESDPTRHAELCLVSAACRTLPREVVQKAILYTSTEPCGMCAGSIVWAGISTVIYGMNPYIHVCPVSKVAFPKGHQLRSWESSPRVPLWCHADTRFRSQRF